MELMRDVTDELALKLPMPGDERMDLTGTRALRAEIPSQSCIGAARESDDYFDFPPTGHPRRELFTASVFVLAMMTFVVWGAWRLISFLLTSLIVPTPWSATG